MTFNNLAVTLNKHHQLYVVYADNPGSFWCQLVENEAAVTSLMDQLTRVYSVLGDSEHVMLNAIADRVCCAKYSSDGQWYRAKVSDTSTCW